MRGSPPRASAVRDYDRSTPAYAGKPTLPQQPLPLPMVYPRVCGEAGTFARGTYWEYGLPPRMRGSRLSNRTRLYPVGSTPAYAGKPLAGHTQSGLVSVYPRVCGEAVDCTVATLVAVGLPPRMRGSRLLDDATATGLRSTPAYAGKPPSAPSVRWSDRVYPRVCGEAGRGPYLHFLHYGLPPRMRGSRLARHNQANLPGSTPAYAGKPLSTLI